MKMPNGRVWTNSSRFSPTPAYKVPVLKFVAVLLALLCARRWAGRRTWAGLGAAALLIAVLSGSIGIGEVAASSAYDYSLSGQTP